MIRVPENDKTENWAGLTSFVMCEKFIYSKNPEEEITREIRFYATDLTDLEVIADAIRSHWQIEEFHWHLDVSFNEDDNSTMNRNAFENLSLLIKLCVHILSLVQSKKQGVSMRRMRKKAAWNFEGMLEEILRYFDIETIVQTLENA